MVAIPTHKTALPRPTEQYCAATDLAYLQIGNTGEPVLLLHGWAAFKELWWATLIGLAPTNRVWAPDMPGHGRSLLLPQHSMADIAERIVRFADARGIDQFTLVGHSMGGNIATELTLAHPERVRRLVLLDAATEGQQMPFYTRSYLYQHHGFAALRLLNLGSQVLNVLGDRVPHEHGGGIVLPALRRISYSSRYDALSMRSLLHKLIGNSLEQRVSQLAVPTLVVSGQFDMVVPASLSRRLAQLIPGARYTEIRGASHNPMDERPRVFVETLLAFMRET